MDDSIKNHSSNLISTGNEPNDCYSYWLWQTDSSSYRKELHYVGFLNESKTLEEKSSGTLSTLVLQLNKSKRNAMHSTFLSVLSLNQFYPEFLMQQRLQWSTKMLNLKLQLMQQTCGIRDLVTLRNIRTVMNMLRSMSKAADLPKYFCPEAICAACCIKNRFTSFKKSTPSELWFGQKTDISHFRIYGYKACNHVPKQKKKSLDDRAEECILFGYGTGST